MDDADVNKIVYGYLQKKGYKNTEVIFREESRLSGTVDQAAFDYKNDQDICVANYILFHNSGEPTNAVIYEKAYVELKKWIENSLDMYKSELDLIMYPIFVHCYIDMIARGFSSEGRRFFTTFQADHLRGHEPELVKLSAITNASHLRENNVAAIFRGNKYNLQLSTYSFEMLISYLQENHFHVLLRIVNQYLNIRVIAGKPKPGAGLDGSLTEQMGILGINQKTLHGMNEQRILWGPLQTTAEEEEALSKALRADLAKNTKTSEHMQAVMHQLRRLRAEPFGPNCPEISRIPLPEPSAPDLQAEIDRLKDLSRKITVSHTILPSIVCYTMHNTYNSLSCLEISPDSTMMATGTQDSYIDLWSLKREKFYDAKPSTELASAESESFSSLSNLHGSIPSDKKRLIGHSGPVYSAKFSRGNRVLLSCSADTTVRLWSLDLFANVVTFQGHRFPVWDVDISPLGYYFASASADRTAKIWCTESMKPLRIFSGHLSDVDCVKFHPNSNYVATGSSDRTARLWDMQSGSCVRLFTGHSSTVLSLAISPDGKSLATGCSDGSINVFDLASSRLLRRLSGHEKAVHSLSFTQEGNALASGSVDCTVKVWDVALISGKGGNSTDNREPLIGSYATKQTPLSKVHFSYRNILFVAGSFSL